MTRDVFVVGAGLMTSVGLSLRETAASVRSGLARFTETPIHDKRFEPLTLAVVPEEALPVLSEPLARTTGLTSRVMRMLRLAATPLREAAMSVPALAPKPGLVLALPETETTIPLDGEAFIAQLGLQAGEAFDAKYALAPYRGRAGGLEAVDHAAALIRKGTVPYMLAGGVDTYRDLYVLGTLDMERRVKSSSNLDGFIPGEGAAFVLLASAKAIETYGFSALAAVSEGAAGFEVGHLYATDVYRGEGLAATVRQLLERVPVESPIGEVFTSFNGEQHWGKEWSVSYLRNRRAFAEDHGTRHPADSYGDLGAAAGTALLALAAHGVKNGYRRAPALVYGSSDRGGRAALLVDAA